MEVFAVFKDSKATCKNLQQGVKTSTPKSNCEDQEGVGQSHASISTGPLYKIIMAS